MNPYPIPNPRAALILLVLWLACAPLGASAKSEQEIDAAVDEAIVIFSKEVKGAEEYLDGAKGVLVVPNVKKAGLVLAGQAGEGALRVNGRSVAYYDMAAASLGFQAGFQEANLLFLFLTQDALDRFAASRGWTAGVDAGITVVDAGSGLSLDTLKAKSSVVAFAYGKRGLMGGWSAKGAKFTKRQGDKKAAR